MCPGNTLHMPITSGFAITSFHVTTKPNDAVKCSTPTTDCSIIDE